MGQVIKRYLEHAKNRDRKPMSLKTAKTVSYELNRFAKELGIESLRDLQPDSMQLWLKSLKKSKSTETLRSYCRDLKAFRRYLVDQYLVRELKELDTPDAPPVGRRNFLEQDVVDRVIEAATDPDLKFILHCGFSAGLRRNEISEARVDWFDLTRGFVHVFSGHGFTTKDHDGRSVPLKKGFKEFLQSYLASRNPAEYVLAPSKVKGKATYRFDPNRRVRSHFQKLKVRCTWHDMRRSFASNLISRGESVYIVAAWLGDLVSVVERSYGFLAPAAGNVDR
jgi:integrase